MELVGRIHGILTDQEINELQDIANCRTQCDGLQCKYCALQTDDGGCLTSRCKEVIARNNYLKREV